MNRLLRKLLALFCPGIDGEPDDVVEPPADDLEDDAADPADETDEPTDEGDEEADPEPEDEPAPRETRAQKTIRETRERAQRAEEDAARARAELEAARRQPAQPAQPTQDQLLWQQEEEALRNPETSDWQRYSINSARAARAAAAEARQANQRTEDMADRAEFAELAADNPALYKAFKDKVEQRLKDIRARGGNAPRRGILQVLIGEAALAGNLKEVIGGKPAPKAPRRPAPRSDVSAGQSGARLSEAERIAKRLENVRI